MKLTPSQTLSCINQRIPIHEFLLNDTSLITPPESQLLILNHLLPITNWHYKKLFLRKYIEVIESSSHPVIDQVYELYCHPNILSAPPVNATEADDIIYTINNISVTIKETPNVLSGGGTTGLRTWEAGMYLGEFLSTYELPGTICEVGCGTGLVGILAHKLNPNHKIIFTDGDVNLLNALPDTLTTNDVHNYDIQPVLWGQSLVPQADYLIGGDVTYDSRAHGDLISTINTFFVNGGKMALIAATSRNQETVTHWEDNLRGFKWLVINTCPEPSSNATTLWYRAHTPEIKVYRIEPL